MTMGVKGREVTSEPSAAREMQLCVPSVLVLELDLWDKVEKLFPVPSPTSQQACSLVGGS